MSTNQNKNEEEVDLGSLFIIIGKGFSRFFNFIGGIFKGIFHLLVSALLFIKENIIKIMIAGFIGGFIGLFLELKTPKKFGANLLVEPNFKSTRQLYDNVNYYNDLVKQKDTTALEKAFNIDRNYAASLKKFEIEPLKIDNDVINSYNDLILSVDTLTIRSYNYELFKASYTDYDYRVHKITVTAERNDVFDKLDDVIISSVVNNKYFNKIKKLTNENLNRTDSLYRENLMQIDSLRRVYMEVMVEEAKKQTTGTSIDLGGQKMTTKELELFDKNKEINDELKDIASEKSKKSEVINVISNFQPIGYEIKGVTKNYAFQLGLLGGALMVLFLIFRKLNAFLENYKK